MPLLVPARRQTALHLQYIFGMKMSSWKILSIRGVDLKIHFSLLFLLIYVVLIASAQFPLVVKQSAMNPSNINGHPLLWGLVFAVSLFFSVVLHEFGHVIVAQSMGVKVRGITLMMLGGISEMERIPQKKYAEFKVSIAGPIVSFGIAGFLLLVKTYTPSAEFAFFCYWLSRVNIVLGIFNLFPAFPLDGGRAFRSLLSVRYGPVRATQTAVKVAKIFAWFLGIWGLLGFNVILVLIAVFIYSSANSELVLLISKNLLKGIRAGEVGIRIGSIKEDLSLAEAAQIMRNTRHTHLPVQTESETPAILSLNSFRQTDPGLWRSMRVKDAMDIASKTIDVSELIGPILPDLAGEGALPLTENGRVVGILRYHDVDEVLAFRSLGETKSSLDDSRG